MKLLPLSMAMFIACAPVFADDGELQIRNISDTPDWETSHADLKQLMLYVPAQTTQGDLVSIEYVTLVDDIGDFVTLRDYARPLIGLYVDGPVDMPENAAAFYGHGERDMYASVSLDDGATWKKDNLSRSADKSSIYVDHDWYPGDVIRPFTATASNKVLATWMSRFCDEGNPTYSMDDTEISNLFASDLVDTSHLGDETA